MRFSVECNKKLYLIYTNFIDTINLFIGYKIASRAIVKFWRCYLDISAFYSIDVHCFYVRLRKSFQTGAYL